MIKQSGIGIYSTNLRRARFWLLIPAGVLIGILEPCIDEPFVHSPPLAPSSHDILSFTVDIRDRKSLQLYRKLSCNPERYCLTSIQVARRDRDYGFFPAVPYMAIYTQLLRDTRPMDSHLYVTSTFVYFSPLIFAARNL